MALLDERQAFLAQLDRGRLGQVKIPLPGHTVHRLVIPHRGTVEFFHDRPAHTAAGTHRHFNKAVVQPAMQQILQHLQTVLGTIHRHVGIACVGLFHAAQNTPCRGEQPRPAALFQFAGRLHSDILLA